VTPEGCCYELEEGEDAGWSCYWRLRGGLGGAGEEEIEEAKA
jgi:hypothetical protein